MGRCFFYQKRVLVVGELKEFLDGHVQSLTPDTYGFGKIFLGDILFYTILTNLCFKCHFPLPAALCTRGLPEDR